MYNIAVIGGGVIGLTTAITIQEELRSLTSVTIFTSDVSPNTTGDVSAGLWTPYLLQNTSQKDIMKWSKATLDYCIDLWKKGKAKEHGITIQPMIKVTTEKFYKPPEWKNIPFGYHEFNKDELLKISKRYKRTYTGGCQYVSCTWEPTIFLPQLQKTFISNGGLIIMKKIESLNQLIEFDLIVNCTGLGAKNLIGDLDMKPVRGQVARTKADMQFYTYLDDSDDGCYIISNVNSVILGGTHQENNYNLKVDESDKKFILNSCYEIIPALSKQPILQHKVGLRPGRKQVRLESEIIKIDDKILKVVHNYGHGGSGITLSIGCAKDATKLVKEILNISQKSKL